jgi:hypothetical protein
LHWKPLEKIFILPGGSAIVNKPFTTPFVPTNNELSLQVATMIIMMICSDSFSVPAEKKTWAKFVGR